MMSYQKIGPVEFDDLKKEGHLAIDVRPEEEKVEGEIEGAVTMNFFDPGFKDEIDKLERDKTYLLHCRSGNRSGKACQIMAGMGFGSLYNLDGGIQAWNDYQLG